MSKIEKEYYHKIGNEYFSDTETLQNRKLRELIEKRIKDGNELCQELFAKGTTHPSIESEIEALEEILEESKK